MFECPGTKLQYPERSLAREHTKHTAVSIATSSPCVYNFGADQNWHTSTLQNRPEQAVAEPRVGRPRAVTPPEICRAPEWMVDGFETARSALAAKRARARRSCGATARCGPRTRTASSWGCWRPRSWRARAA